MKPNPNRTIPLSKTSSLWDDDEPVKQTETKPDEQGHKWERVIGKPSVVVCRKCDTVKTTNLKSGTQVYIKGGDSMSAASIEPACIDVKRPEPKVEHSEPTITTENKEQWWDTDYGEPPEGSKVIKPPRS